MVSNGTNSDNETEVDINFTGGGPNILDVLNLGGSERPAINFEYPCNPAKSELTISDYDATLTLKDGCEKGTVVFGKTCPTPTITKDMDADPWVTLDIGCVEYTDTRFVAGILPWPTGEMVPLPTPPEPPNKDDDDGDDNDGPTLPCNVRLFNVSSLLIYAEISFGAMAMNVTNIPLALYRMTRAQDQGMETQVPD